MAQSAAVLVSTTADSGNYLLPAVRGAIAFGVSGVLCLAACCRTSVRP